MSSIISAFLLFITPLCALELSPLKLQEVTAKIWQNECGGTKEGLTSWNRGEEFPSLGICHSIWYPEGVKGNFAETFPEFLIFLQKKGIALPAWLLIASSKGAPWKSREEFEAERFSKNMCELRDFLYAHREMQTLFLISRFETSFLQVKDTLSMQDKACVEARCSALMQTSRGIYALLDYLNFKGEGSLPSERYAGKGWGLLQVLLEMPSDTKDPVAEFSKAAKIVLERRVANSPQERGEQRWLKGWLKRVERY